jgi:hypothetical protein
MAVGLLKKGNNGKQGVINSPFLLDTLELKSDCMVAEPTWFML